MRASERLTAAIRIAEARGQDFQRRREALMRARCSPEDFDRYTAQGAEIDRLQTLITANAEALAHHRSELERAQKAEALEALDREAAAADREAAQWARKEMPRLLAFLTEGAQRLSALQAHRASIEAVNTKLKAAGRPAIVNGEDRVRESQAVNTPAKTELRDHWTDGAGRSPSVFRRNAEGRDEPVEAGYHKTTVEAVVEPARVVPAHRPPSYAETINFAGVKRGDAPIWPPRG